MTMERKCNSSPLGCERPPLELMARGLNRVPVEIDGTVFVSYSEAGRALGMDSKSVAYRCKSDAYPAWRLRDGRN